MEVRCSRCATDYVFDGSRVGPRGVSVKCAACGHLFRVYRPEEGPRQWQVRHADGRRVEFKELTTLQRWIVEGRIKRDHEISRDGGTWKSLGEIKELEPFFDIVERAERAEQKSEDVLSAPIAPLSTDRSSALRSHIYSPAELEPIRQAAQREAYDKDLQTEPAPRPASRPESTHIPISMPVEITGDAPYTGRRPGGAFWALAVLLLVGAGAFAWWGGWLNTGFEATAAAPPEVPAVVPPTARLETTTTPTPTDSTDATGAERDLKTPSASSPPPPTAPSGSSTPPPEPALRREARRKAPVAPPDMLAAGRRALKDESWSDALDAFGRASELSPDRAEPHAGKGAAYLGLGRADLALDSFRTALRLDPSYVSARLGVGRALLATGDEAGARLAIRAFLERAPKNHPERSNAQALLRRRP